MFTVEQVPYNDGTERKVNAWLFDVVTAESLRLGDRALGNEQLFRVRILAKPKELKANELDNPLLSITWISANVANSGYSRRLDSQDWATYETVLKTPVWTGGSALFDLKVDTADAYIAAVAFEKLNPENETHLYSKEGNSYTVENAGQITVADTDVAELCRFEVTNSFGFLELVVNGSAFNGYARNFQRWVIQYGIASSAIYATATQEGTDISNKFGNQYEVTNVVTVEVDGNEIVVKSDPDQIGASGNKTVVLDYHYTLHASKTALPLQID